MQKATPEERRMANERVTEGLTEALNSAVNGDCQTGARLVSAIVIVAYDDGNVTTRIAGLINKNHMFGALTEATLSIHELDKALVRAEHQASDIAMVEKYTTDVRSDN